MPKKEYEDTKDPIDSRFVKPGQFQKMKQTDTTKLEYPQETEDLDGEQLEEKAEGATSIGKRSLICKTMATIKSRSTFIENGIGKSSGRVNVSTLVFGNDSTNKPTLHKGSSDVFVLGVPSQQDFGPNNSLNIRSLQNT